MEANVALNMFNQAAIVDTTVERFHHQSEARRKITIEVEAELFPDGMLPPTMVGEDFRVEFDRRRVLVDRRVRQLLWQTGFLPQSLQHKVPFVCAKAFVHSLDLFDKFLGNLERDTSAPRKLKVVHQNFCDALPDLRGVRDSIQHLEERSKGEQKRQKIPLKEIDKTKISIEGTALVNLALSGNRFGTTMADGHYGSIDVTEQTVAVMLKTLLEVYSVFEWSGPETLYPR